MREKCFFCELEINLKQKDIKVFKDIRKEKETITIGSEQIGGPSIPYHPGCLNVGFKETGRYIKKRYICFEFKCPICKKINEWEKLDETNI